MKKIYLILAVALASCATPKPTATVTGVTYVDGKVCATGTIVITAPSQAVIDSTIAAITKNIISYTHVSDSANVHVYKWNLCSPVLK